MTSDPMLRAFLICDIRGYSAFASQRGDDATARLAQRFQDIASAVLPSYGGEILGRRGDEVLAAFRSARDAVRAAVAFQRALLAATREDRDLPLPAGLGMDFGEAVVADGEWSANAINVAARLCSVAAGGEVLATEEMRHIAQVVDGVTYVERAPISVKGVSRPVRHVRVVATDGDIAAQFRELGLAQAAVARSSPHRRRRRVLIGAAAVVAVVGAAATTIVVEQTSGTAAPRLSPNVLAALDLSGTTAQRGSIDVGANPRDIAVDGKAVWVVSGSTNTVTRVDVDHAAAAAEVIQVGQNPSAVAVGYGAVWVTNGGDKSVSRINPGAPPTVGDTISVGNDPAAVASGFGLVWVANEIDDTVTAIDPTAHNGRPADRVVATIPVGGGPDAIAIGFDSVWVTNAGTSSVSRIDPKTMVATASVSVGNSPQSIGADSEGVWVVNGLDGTVSHIDPTTEAVTATVRVGTQPSAVAVDDHHVWVASAEALTDIDPRTGRIARSLSMTNSPTSLAIGGDQLWLTTGGAAAARRGGTLSIVQNVDDATSFDPAVAYSQFGWAVLATSNDGLLTFEHIGGAAGALLVPDLAARMPQVSDNGLTYTFQLRSGVRYSTGARVRASDFRASMERDFRIAKTPPYYSAIVGASACAAKPSTCDLTQGIVTNDSTGTITIHLIKPDASLEDELALPFADVLPAGTPARDLKLGPHPATGPYVITEQRGTTTLLTRNPYFRQWSVAAQPTGYPDRVVITTASSSETANVAAVARGQFDWTPDRVTGTQLDDLIRTQTSQLHPYPDNSVHYFFLNTAVPPFTDVRVRQAVNFAIDRRRAAAELDGPLEASVTCQILAPSLYGYQPHCPYTVNASPAGVWNGPDLPKARALIAHAHAAGTKVKVVVPADHAALGTLLAATLRSIGLDATATTYPASPDGSDTAYYDYITTRANHVQAALESWLVDYPEPANLFGPLLECAARTSPTTLDESLFCNPAVDRAIANTLDEQQTDPASARMAWSAIDKTIDNQAPWVPLTNGRQYDIVSARVGDYQHNPAYGMLIDQAWVN